MAQEYLIGRGVSQVFEEVLRAGRAFVISPWIQEPYASRLLAMVREGRALVITSRSQDNAFYRLVASRRVSKPIGLGTSTVLLMIGMLALLLWRFLAPLLILAPFFILVGVIGVLLNLRRRASQGNNWLVNVRFSPGLGEDGFIHVKLYIAGDNAWIGSANMTVSAWKRNIEVLVPIDLPTARKIFEKAWSMVTSLQ